jgi:hypothetical protein
LDARSYIEKAELEEARSLELAEAVLKQGERFAREGRQRAAKKAFEAAMNYSMGQDDFNEDARIQYRNLAKQQAIVGLVNRRADLKRSWNVHEEPAAPAAGLEEGMWTMEYGEQVAQSLSSKDSDSLDTVAERILDQQAAAAGLAPALRVTLPLRGRQLGFRRTLQITPLADMTVVVKSSAASRRPWFLSLLAAAGVLALYRAGLGFAGAARPA